MRNRLIPTLENGTICHNYERKLEFCNIHKNVCYDPLCYMPYCDINNVNSITTY